MQLPKFVNRFTMHDDDRCTVPTVSVEPFKNQFRYDLFPKSMECKCDINNTKVPRW